jgi:hypothetical protein
LKKNKLLSFFSSFLHQHQEASRFYEDTKEIEHVTSHYVLRNVANMTLGVELKEATLINDNSESIDA